MERDSQDKTLNDVLSLMEKSYQNSDKPWEALYDADNQDICRDLMDVRFVLHEEQAINQVDVNAELERFKRKQQQRRYVKMLFVWSSVAAVLFIGIFLSFNYWTSRVLTPKEVMVFAADTTSQQVILASADGKQLVLDGAGAASSKKKAECKHVRNVLDYTKLKSNVTPVLKTMLQTHTITIPRGKTFKLVLNDGTEVWLNANSKLIYPTEFVEEERSVFLEGEAYFKVAKGKKPFIVKTDYLQTRVLGTEFNVRSYQPDDVHVTLISGKVQVSNASNTSSVRLIPGNDASLRSDGQFEMQEVNSDAYTYWKDGYFYFDQLPLLEIMQSIGRWYNVNVVFRNKEAMDYHMYFISNRDDDIKNVIELMNRLKKVTLTYHEGTLYVD